MTHAEVAAIIEGAIGTPGRLRALLAAATPEGDALRAHLADCAECRGEADAWQAVDEALVAVTPDTMTAPASAKARILSNVVATGVARSPDRVLGQSPAAGIAASAAGGAAATPVSATGAAAPAAGPSAEPPNAGRVWRTPGGQPLPSPGATAPGAVGMPPAPAAPSLTVLPGSADVPPATAAAPTPATAAPATAAPAEERRRGMRLLPGGKDRDGVGFRVFLAVAAAAVFLFALGAALGGPLGLTTPTTVQDDTARVELEKVVGRMSDLLQQPGAVVAPLSDQAGEPAGAVVLAPAETRVLGVVTRALPAPTDDTRYVCVLIRSEERFEVGYMKFAADPTSDGDVAYWIAPLSDAVPMDVGAPGDVFNVSVEGETGGPPLLTTTF
jgi:hypothetical protein